MFGGRALHPQEVAQAFLSGVVSVLPVDTRSYAPVGIYNCRRLLLSSIEHASNRVHTSMHLSIRPDVDADHCRPLLLLPMRCVDSGVRYLIRPLIRTAGASASPLLAWVAVASPA